MKPPFKPFTVEVKRSRSTTSVAKPISSEPPVLIEAQPASAPVPPSQARQLAEQMFATLTTSSSAAPETKVTAQSVFRTVPSPVVPVAKPDVEPVAEGVFRASAPPPAPVHAPDPNPSATKLLSLKGVVPAKLREPHGEKVPTSRVAESVFRTAAPPAVTMEASDAEPAPNPSPTQLPSVEEAVPAKPPNPRTRKVRTEPALVNEVVKSNVPTAGKLAAPSAPARPQRNPLLQVPEVKFAGVKLTQAGPASPAAEAQLQGRQNWGWSPGERWKRRLRYLR
ncbi:hypothetical protein GCM10007874_45280 [Labrys miyagiensis]|uniref:Uncharacterized protein n=1 Tax=Labrys miyagiensis TaxID=346912 RepID=A0ABQ6CMF8_9HYPH|nr:hypothetical protein [Labrys miyagiensis]GLS21511.1 hypothetical protein GCM10007874_45280 [Labrys miyagiensis]